MSLEVYELIAKGARYWFAFLGALIVLRSFRWLWAEARTRRKALHQLPDAGYVGELYVLEGAPRIKEGASLPIGREGTIGRRRRSDICLPHASIPPRMARFVFRDGQGILLTLLGQADAVLRAGGLEKEITRADRDILLPHGCAITLGEIELQVRMFAGLRLARATLRLDGDALEDDDESYDDSDDTQDDEDDDIHDTPAYEQLGRRHREAILYPPQQGIPPGGYGYMPAPPQPVAYTPDGRPLYAAPVIYTQPIPVYRPPFPAQNDPEEEDDDDLDDDDSYDNDDFYDDEDE